MRFYIFYKIVSGQNVRKVYIINSINVDLFNSKLQSEKEDEKNFYNFFVSAKNQFEQRRDVLSLCLL